MSYFSMNLSIYIEKHPEKYFPLLYDKKRLPDLTSDSLFFIVVLILLVISLNLRIILHLLLGDVINHTIVVS